MQDVIELFLTFDLNPKVIFRNIITFCIDSHPYVGKTKEISSPCKCYHLGLVLLNSNSSLPPCTRHYAYILKNLTMFSDEQELKLAKCKKNAEILISLWLLGRKMCFMHAARAKRIYCRYQENVSVVYISVTS